MGEQSVKEILRKIPSLKGPLPNDDLTALPRHPQEAFKIWLEDALDADIREPHAMTLSTADENGWPDARVLILKNVDERGWHFAIKAGSPKGRQIETNSQVALTFYWPAMGRQIRMRGPALALPAEECASDFLERPIGSRTAAMASLQSEVLSDEEDLNIRLEEAQAFLEANPEHVESGWRVYAVAPLVVEFWQGATDRNHKRQRYTLAEDGKSWLTARLWP